MGPHMNPAASPAAADRFGTPAARNGAGNGSSCPTESQWLPTIERR